MALNLRLITQVLFLSTISALLTNSIAAAKELEKYSLTQSNLKFSAPTVYTIKFTPVTPILNNRASIRVTWPSNIVLYTPKFDCSVRTDQLYDKKFCYINKHARSIIIEDVFRTVGQSKKYENGFKDEIKIELANVRNPRNNREQYDGFGISTYSDRIQKNVLDVISAYQNELKPRFECDYPCKECDSANGKPSFCTKCWAKGSFNPHYLMKEKGTCQLRCNHGFTSNGRTDKKCQRCDDSCNGCLDNGKRNDRKQCIECSEEYPFRKNSTNLCFQKCEGRLFKWGPRICGQCEMPCKTCKITASTCTSCYKEHPRNLSKLWKNQCIYKCPKGFTLVENKCEQCKSPCSTCIGTVDNCVTCDGTRQTRFVSDGKCFQDCPKGTVLKAADDINCIDCKVDNCDMCAIKDLTQCLICKSGMYVFQGKCLNACPQGFVAYDGSACSREWLQEASPLRKMWIWATTFF